MKKMTKKNEKMDILSKKLSKNCNLVQLKMMGKFLQTSPMKNDDTVCLYSKNNKIILFCTHMFGYFIYKHHTVGLVLKVNPQLHCCYQTQSIKHTHRKILSKMFLVFRKKRKHAKASTSKNGHITKKSPWLQCFIYDNICNTIIKSPGQIRCCTSHCLASIKKTVFEHASEHQRNETSQFCV